MPTALHGLAPFHPARALARPPFLAAPASPSACRACPRTPHATPARVPGPANPFAKPRRPVAPLPAQGPFPMVVRCLASKCYVSNRHNDSFSSHGDEVQQKGCLFLERGEEHVLNITFTQNPLNGLVVIWDPSTPPPPGAPPGAGMAVGAETNCPPPACAGGVIPLFTPVLGGSYVSEWWQRAPRRHALRACAPLCPLNSSWGRRQQMDGGANRRPGSARPSARPHASAAAPFAEQVLVRGSHRSFRAPPASPAARPTHSSQTTSRPTTRPAPSRRCGASGSPHSSPATRRCSPRRRRARGSCRRGRWLPTTRQR